jgi:uncharacterized membrane protein YdjX (TVP38/TMEM64 family)
MATGRTGKKIALVLGFAGLLAFFYFSGLGKFLTLATLKANREALALYYADHRLLMVASFIGVYIVQTALSLPGAALMSLAAGAIFGAFSGTLYSVIGATVGATAAFLATRYLLHDMMQRRFGERLEGINRELERRGLNYLLFLRLVPVFPFFLINLAAALTRLPFRTFFIGTFLGIIPGGFVFCNAGASLALVSSLSEVASPRVLGSFALLGLFALLPALYAKFRERRENHE